MRHINWWVLVGCLALTVGCKESAEVLPAGRETKTDSGRSSKTTTSVAPTPMDSQAIAASSALLNKPIAVESGHFDVRQSGDAVLFPGMKMNLPQGWTLQTSVPSPRLSNLTTPEGLTIGVFWFGNSGGSVEENLKRWEGQFSQLTSREVTKDTIHEPRTTMARWQGTYAGDNGMNPGRPGETSVMLVAIVEGSRGSVFFKTVGTISQTNAARGLLRTAIKELVPQP